MRRWLSMTLLLGIVVAACKPKPTAAPTPAPTPTPSPADYLAMAADAMTRIETVQFSLTHEGAPVVLDPTLGAQFVSATGAYESPDRVHATVKADFARNILALEMLWLPEGNFISNPLTGAYEPLPASVPLDPVAMFGATAGISTILRSGLHNPELVGMETVDESQARHIRGSATADVLTALVPAPLSSDVELQVDVWIEVDTSRVVRIELTEESGDTTVVEFFAYDEPVTIPSPG